MSYDIPLETVRGVLKPQQLTPAPGAPSGVLGVANVRGAVVPVLDLTAFEAAEKPAAFLPDADKRQRLVMLDGQALAVDAVQGLAWVTAAAAQRLARLLALTNSSAASVSKKPDSLSSRPLARTLAPIVRTQEQPIALVSFQIADQHVAIRLKQLHATLRSFSPNPNGFGAIVYNGGRLPVISIAEALGGASPGAATDNRVAIVRSAGGLFGLRIDRFTGTLRPLVGDVDLAGPTLGRGVISHVVRLKGGAALAAVLNIETLAVLARRTAPLLPPEQARSPTMAMRPEARTGAERLLVFTLAGRRYAAPLACVEGVMRAPPAMTRAPGVLASGAGVLVMRGEVTPVLPVSDETKRSWLVLVRMAVGRVALAVEALPELASLEIGPSCPSGASLFPRAARLSEGGVAPVLDPGAPLGGIAHIADAFRNAL